MLLKQDGTVWATGGNEYGQLGDGSTTSTNGFVKAIDGHAQAVAAGYAHSMVLGRDGSVWTTGDNTFGQLANNGRDSQKHFAMVRRGEVKGVFAGWTTACC